MALPSPCSGGEQTCTSTAWLRPALPRCSEKTHASSAHTHQWGLTSPCCPFCAQSSGLLFKARIWIWNSCGHHSLIQSANNCWALPCAKACVQASASQPWGRHTPNSQTAHPLAGEQMWKQQGGAVPEAHAHSLQHPPPPQCTCLCHLLVLGSPITAPRLS